MKEYPSGCVIERADGSFEIKPRMPLGRLDAETLNRVNEVVRTYGLPGVRATAAQRIVLEGVQAEQVDDIVERISGVGEQCPAMITLCPGKGSCKRGVRATRVMAAKLEALFTELGAMPTVVKCGLSGCARCCGESYVRDIGLMGTAKGWTVLFGGNAGRKVRAGDELAVNMTDAETLDMVRVLLTFYADNGRKRERTARFVERIGTETVKLVLS